MRRTRKPFAIGGWPATIGACPARLAPDDVEVPRHA